MTTHSRRRMLAARFVLCACAIVGACGRTSTDDDTQAATSNATSRDDSSRPIERNELQDWARQATSGSGDTPQHSQHQQAAAHEASDALATPVIHTVD